MKNKDLEYKRVHIGSRLRKQRLLLFLSQNEASELAGISRKTVNKIETGKNVDENSLILYAYALGFEIMFRLNE